MIIGQWERAPCWLRWLGKPAYRRWNHVAHIGGIFGEWEYSTEPPANG